MRRQRIIVILFGLSLGLAFLAGTFLDDFTKPLTTGILLGVAAATAGLGGWLLGGLDE